jgi:hypothetical protein
VFKSKLTTNFKMNIINNQECRVSNNDIVISRRAIVKFVYVMIYLYICALNYKRVVAYFAKKVDVKVQETVEEQEESLEKNVNTWYTIEDGKGRYKGEWKNGLPNGKGIKHLYKTDSYIEGNFVDGYTEGYGKQTFEQTWEETQPYYEGEFKRDNWEGKGVYYEGDGDYYKGMWKNGKYHGHGGMYSSYLDKTWVGEYENDKKVEDNGNWVNGEI